eukprot:gene7471-10184_t
MAITALAVHINNSAPAYSANGNIYIDLPPNKNQLKNMVMRISNFICGIDATVITFIIGSVLASIPKKPLNLHSNLESAAWDIFLQSSLVLSIIGNLTNKFVDKLSQVDNKSNKIELTMVIGFILGTFSSIIGGIMGSKIVKLLSRLFVHLSHINVIACMSCLTASYIGGTVNFFDTAKLLKLNGDDLKVIQLLAAGDIAVMILYFAVLNILKSRADVIVNSIERSCLLLIEFGIAILITSFGSVIQKRFAIPGISVLISVISSIAIRSIILRSDNKFIKYRLKSLQDISEWIPLFVMFGCILSIHVSLLFLLAYFWNKLCFNLNNKSLLLDLDTLLISSNACVGGASTAASMAASFKRADLVLSASFIGVIGYIIGTPIGLQLFKFLKYY